MRLIKARVKFYRSIIDSDWFEVENLKTIIVGPNEAGKTVLLRALQQLNKPKDVKGFDALRDYPRSLYNDITTGKADPKNVKIVEGIFMLDDKDKEKLPEEFKEIKYQLTVYLDNHKTYQLLDAPGRIIFKDVKKDLTRIKSHIDKQFKQSEPEEGSTNPIEELNKLISDLKDEVLISGKLAKNLKKWLESNLEFIDEDDEKEEQRFDKLIEQTQFNERYDQILVDVEKRIPVFVLFNNYFKVKPSIHLEHLAYRTEKNILNDKYYDYGNLCLLKLLGFTPRELSNLGNAGSPNVNDRANLKIYNDKLDKRRYQLNAASVKLTTEINSVWKPRENSPEANKLKVVADGQYLNVMVEDELGVEIELDQRSEGYQWLVSFFVVFFAESMDKHENAILLLDEPGLSLHALKQRDFRDTISRLAKANQTIYTTHSPFLVGPDELDIVRVIEMKDRMEGTKVHTTISSSDPAGLLPLQEALGYDLAQSLFAQQRNLVLEGITDYWYLEATASLLREDKVIDLNEQIALVFANSAGKVVYYSTILFAHNLKVAALLDSDSAGDQAANQENLVHTLGNTKILRTKDYVSDVKHAEIEDLLRETLTEIVKTEYSVDLTPKVTTQSTRPIVDIFSKEVHDFSKYKLAKAYVRWTRSNNSNALQNHEVDMWKKLIGQINKVLK